MSSSNRRLPWHVHLLVLLAFLLLSLALTWPLAGQFSSHVPGNAVDDPPLTWNLWWVGNALLEQKSNPFDVDYLFYPLGINMAFYTLTVLNGLLSIPLQAVFGLVTASNLLLLSSFVLSGYGAFLLAHSLLHGIGRAFPPSSQNRNGGDQPPPGAVVCVAAFSAGLLYAFASSKLFYAALGQWNIASSQWVPFYVLYLFKIGSDPHRWRYPLFGALFLLLQAYAELTYASFLAIFTLIWVLWQVVRYARTERKGSIMRLFGSLAVMCVVFVVGMAPVLGMMIPDLLSEGDIFVEGGGFAAEFSADLLGYLIPTKLHPLLGSLPAAFQFDHTVGQHIFLGFATAAVVVIGVVAWRRLALAGFWLGTTLFFWLLTLGPSLRINGRDTGLPLPFALVAQLPFFQGNRYPSRYSVLLVLGLAVLVAFGVLAILQRRRGKRQWLTAFLVPILVALVLFEHLSIPLPLTDMRVPLVYHKIAEEMPGKFTLLDLPVAWRNGFRVTGTPDPIIMLEQYYQSVHGKPVLAGNTSRNPPLKFQYFTEAPVINTLIALETGHSVDPSVAEQDRLVAQDVLRFLNIAAVVVHPAEAGEAVVRYVEDILAAEKMYESSSEIAYRVSLPPWPQAWTIRPGEELARLSMAEGWGVPANGVVWAQRAAARLLVPLSSGGKLLRVQAYAPRDGQQMIVAINGHRLEPLVMGRGWLEYRLAVPAEMVQEGLNEVWFRFADLVPAEQVQISPREIGETGVVSPVNLVVQSAGLEVGDFARVFVDGVDISPNERGYNVAVIDPESGDVERQASFDTHLDPEASSALASFLHSVAPGKVVAIAAADEASRLLGADAVEALRTIGATGDLRDRFRWGHAIIGAKGAPPGSALEGMEWMRPVTLVVGEGATESSLAAAFSAMSFSEAAQP